MRGDDVGNERSVVVQARALAGEHRYQLLREVIVAGLAGVGVAELADGLGVTRTAVRLHLARLVACGLVVARPSPPIARGRHGLPYLPTSAAER